MHNYVQNILLGGVEGKKYLVLEAEDVRHTQERTSAMTAYWNYSKFFLGINCPALALLLSPIEDRKLKHREIIRESCPKFHMGTSK